MGTMNYIKGSMKVHAQVWHAQKGHSSEVKTAACIPFSTSMAHARKGANLANVGHSGQAC